MDSEDIPFKLIGGLSKEIKEQNMVNAINRLNYLIRKQLPEFDIRTKSQTFKNMLDLELFKKYYEESPEEPVNEEFCQRVAKVCIEMEKDESSIPPESDK